MKKKLTAVLLSLSFVASVLTIVAASNPKIVEWPPWPDETQTTTSVG